MAGSYRHQTLIEAPIEDVWAVISDPLTHPDWWPDVVEVRLEEPLVEGGEYIRSSRFSLTPAQAETFVELETGMDPTRLRWRLLKVTSGSFFKGWILDVLDALPKEVVARQLAARD
jgi:hypothetical protein